MNIDNKKVFFLTKGGIECCTYIRSYLPQLLNNWSGDYLNRDCKELLNSDVVVFQRQAGNDVVEMIKTLKQLGKRVVWDIDDTYLDGGLVSKLMGKKWKEIEEKKARDIAKEVDMISCSTQTLADEWKSKFPEKEVVVLENCMYKEWFPKEIKKNNTDKLRFCICGSCLYKTEWNIIKDLLQKIIDDGNTIVLFGVNKFDKALEYTIDTLQGKENVEIVESVDVENYYNTLNNLEIDCFLIPREDKYFNYCKSNIKFLEASMLEIPCIVSSFKDNNSPYDNLPNNTCFKCKTLDDWFYSYEKIKDNEIRNTIALNAKKYVLDNYNIEKRYKEWRNAYNKLFE